MVIAIIGILVALLLPAIQAAREAARRAQCTNNLKQIGIGILNHHDTYDNFPSAGTNSPDYWTAPETAVTAGFQRYGWGFQILPFVEETALYDIAKRAEATIRPVHFIPELDKALLEVQLSLYSCPSRGPRTCAVSSGTIIALGDYAAPYFQGLGGQWQNDYAYTGNVAKNYKLFGWRGIISKGGHYNTTAGYNKWRGIRMKDLSDGSSHTIAVMEKSVYFEKYNISTSSWGGGGAWAEMDGWAANAHASTMRCVSGDGGTIFSSPYFPFVGAGTAGQGRCGNFPLVLRDDEPTAGTVANPQQYNRGDDTYAEVAWGSAHPGGMLAVFGDGAVRSVSFDVDTEMAGVFYRLWFRDDGMTIPDDSF